MSLIGAFSCQPEPWTIQAFPEEGEATTESVETTDLDFFTTGNEDTIPTCLSTEFPYIIPSRIPALLVLIKSSAS